MKKILLNRIVFKIILFLISVITFQFFSQSIFGATFNLTASWTPNTEPDIAGYKLFRTDGTRTQINQTLIPPPNSSFGPFSITVPDGSYGTLIFVMRSVDINNLESPDSDPAYFSYDLRPTVTITATDNTATENPLTTGYFTVTRTGSTTSALTVSYSVSGTATAGSDYNSLSGSVTIPAGSTSATITVTPINDTVVESDETVIVTLNTNSAYNRGSPYSATVTITSDDVALPYTVNTNPGGLEILVDSTPYTAPKSFDWASGSKHTLSAPSPQYGGSGVKYVFTSWSDGGSQTHTITTPSSTKTYTANFKIKYSLTTSVNLNEGGTVNPSGTNWYNKGKEVSITATPKFGYRFIGWAGDSSETKKSITLVMNGPKELVANFEPIPEEISTPTKPSGVTSGSTGTSYTFSTSSSSNLLHSIEYQYDWGDGSTPVWGKAKQSHIWKVEGEYQVRVKARCSTHTNIESAWSNSIRVLIKQKPFIHITSPAKGETWVVGSTHTIIWDSNYLNPAGTLYLFYWYGNAWHPIVSLSPAENSYTWTVPDIHNPITSPKPSGNIQTITIWIGNWVIGSDGKGKWECWDINDPNFRILDDGWTFTISGNDTGGTTLWFGEDSFEGYGVSFGFGMFKTQGTYEVDEQRLVSGTFTLYDLSDTELESGSLTGNINSNATKMTLVLKDLNNVTVFSMKGKRLLSDPEVSGNWTATITGSATGSFDPFTIRIYQDYSLVYQVSGTGTITGEVGYITNIQGDIYRTNVIRTNSYGKVIGNVVYGVYEMSGGINETGVISGTLNPDTGKFTFNLTSDDGVNKYKLVGQEVISAQ